MGLLKLPRLAERAGAPHRAPTAHDAAVSKRGERDDDNASDDLLMARIGRGDQGAFAVFVRRHTGRSLALAQRLVGNEGDAEEIVQDALSRVWRHADRWHGRARVTTWLYRIVFNLAHDNLRRRPSQLVPVDEAGELVDPAASAEALLSQHQLAAGMARAIAELPPRQRAALSLCFYESCDCAEAAQIMGISISAMESLLVRARRQLRQRMSELSGEQMAARPEEPVSPRQAAPAAGAIFPIPGKLRSF